MTVPGSDPLPSSLDALADLRSAAKWTLLAAGAVGAALIGGGPLVAVGQVHGVAHAVLAGLGLVIALTGVGLAIWHTSRVLEPRLTTPEDLASGALAGLRQQVERDPVWFFGYVATTVEDLRSYQVIAANLARQFTAETDAARRELIEPRLRQVERDAARAEPYVRFLVAAAHVWKLNEELRRSRWYTMLGGVFVVIGAVLFFTAAGGH
jgi:hypothetical protein